LPEPATRDRLIAAAMELFASRGYQATTVGEIEAAAGFTARGGTLYKHFPSKQALLDAAVDQQVAEVRQGRAIADLLPLGDLHAETVLVFRYLFAELTRYRAITALVEKEGAGTDPLSERFWDEIAEPGYRLTAEILDRQLNKDGHGKWDAEALAALFVGAAVNIRRAEWTFGQLALNVDEERLISTIAGILQALSAVPGGDPAP
jgi:AcrR family transcriptional regulator